jgi:hypothetical protein
MTNENASVYIPAHKAPYNGLRNERKGVHFRTYTIAAACYAGLVTWNVKEGKMEGFAKGNPDLFSRMIGTSAGNYWNKAGRFQNGEFTKDGRDVIEKSLKGEASGGYNASIPGLVSAYIAAFDTGILKEPGTGNVIERWNAKFPKPEQPAQKAAQKPAQPAKVASGTKPAQKAAKPAQKAAQKAAPSTKAKAAPVLITPKAKV